MAYTLILNESAYLPGDKITGNFSWQFEGKAPKLLSIKLMWITQGEGIADLGIIEEIKISATQPMGTYDFTTKLPPFPWSYQGKKFSIDWVVIAQADNKEITRVTFISAPYKEPLKA